MLDIFNLIRNGAQYIVRPNLGKTFDSFIEKDADEYHLLVGNWNLMDRWSIDRLFGKYYIQELFELSNCYLGSYNEPYMYWHITKKKSKTIKTAIFFGYSHPYRDNEDLDGKLQISNKYTDEYKQYISILEDWVKTGKLPSDIKNMCEFNVIEESEYDYSKPYARYYRKSNKELRELLRTAEIVPLKEVADVISVTARNGGNDVTRVKSLDPNQAPAYPYIPELQAIDYVISTEKLHKDDIVELGHNKFFWLIKRVTLIFIVQLGSQSLEQKSSVRSICICI